LFPGAYGAAVLFSEQRRRRVQGIEQADSVTFDPHKWLVMPFSARLVLTPHVDALQRTFSVPCPYLEKASAENLPDNLSISAQWSRRLNPPKLWLTLGWQVSNLPAAVATARPLTGSHFGDNRNP
jgi:glutamate/tyrosine decarboxylase-like PLP-dependent enzyme